MMVAAMRNSQTSGILFFSLPLSFFFCLEAVCGDAKKRARKKVTAAGIDTKQLSALRLESKMGPRQKAMNALVTS